MENAEKELKQKIEEEIRKVSGQQKDVLKPQT